MPYIKFEDQARIESGERPKTPGELNYLLSSVALKYWVNSPENYAAINDILGAFEGAKQEFYRRIAVPYENKKIRDNGDIFPEV